MSDVAPRHSGVDDYTVPSTKPDEMLLPLLQPKEGTLHASAPPLHNLPNSQLSGRRIAWRTKAASSSSFSSSTSYDVDWITTTHTYPAAYPRTHAHCTAPSSQPYRRPVALPAPALASAEAEKAYDRGKRAEDGQFWRDEMRVLNDVARYFPPKSKAEGLRRAQEARERMEPQLWCTAQRIIPVRHYPEEQNAGSGSAGAGAGGKKKEPVTLLLMHATGFHKEVSSERVIGSNHIADSVLVIRADLRALPAAADAAHRRRRTRCRGRSRGGRDLVARRHHLGRKRDPQQGLSRRGW